MRKCMIIFFLSMPCFSAPFFGQHVFYHPSYSNMKPNQYSGVRLWDSAGTKWNQIEKARGEFDFSQFDLHINNAKRLNYDVIYTLGQTPEWASARPTEKGNNGMGAAAEPSNMNDWANYVEKVVQRYKGKISAYELMNEPRIPEAVGLYSPGFFSGSTPKLIEMGRIAAAIIKREDPNAKMVCPGFDGSAFGVKRLDYFLSKKGGDFCDVIAFHYYPVNWEIEEVVRTTSSIRAVLNKYKLNHLPIWNTELGLWNASAGTNVKVPATSGFASFLFSDKDSAKIYAKYMTALIALGINRNYWFAYDSSGMGSTLPDKSKGLLNQLGVAEQELKKWFDLGDVSTNLNITDSASSFMLSNNGKLTGKIVWGGALVNSELAKSKPRKINFLNGDSIEVVTNYYPLFKEKSRDFSDPVLFVY